MLSTFPGAVSGSLFVVRRAGIAVSSDPGAIVFCMLTVLSLRVPSRTLELFLASQLRSSLGTVRPLLAQLARVVPPQTRTPGTCDIGIPTWRCCPGQTLCWRAPFR